jgi:hypothetical protein
MLPIALFHHRSKAKVLIKGPAYTYPNLSQLDVKCSNCSKPKEQTKNVTTATINRQTAKKKTNTSPKITMCLAKLNRSIAIGGN